MTNQQTAYNLVSLLVQDFQENESKFLSPSYSEADVRKDFIDKFFNALGWDVYHNEQKNPYEQEVKIEKGVYVGKQQKRADYAFHLAPNFRDIKFYVEAKKPSRNLTNADDYFQSIRYGWNAGTPITFLTDFEEIHILDCRIKPDISSILNYRIKKYNYSDFLNEELFSEIYWLLSREAVADNSLEKFADALPKPKGKAIQKGTHRKIYQSIDEAFLEELDEIRDTLAKAFKKANPHLESEPLTEMTQRMIDRLVFIRFLEDKQIEPDHYVSEFANSKSAWKDFKISSRKLDAKYNGIVFKKHSIDSDNFIPPDDKVFSSICEELAHLNSPYNFDIIPIHILGSIYERFLGKVVIATDKRVRIEEKPEVRKAGGVYYTPQYIVNYIVDNTVGKLIEGKSPKEIAGLRFADISCGSGSFLITVFDRLLEHHRKWYQDNPEQAKKDGCYFHEGKWILSLKQKQKILTNNIYGVDLDHQAVEVTQLSLYLKLLEDETTATAQDTWVMFKEQLLPNLNNNIVCGNSLIGTDILNPTQSLPFSKEEDEGGVGGVDELKLKPMNFEDVFREVMRKGGFDAIVGNPPYIHSRDNQLDENVRNYYNSVYKSSEYQLNTYGLFIEKSIHLLKTNGLLSYIVPNYWLANKNDTSLRNTILYDNHLTQLINVYNIFHGAIVDTLVMVLKKEKVNNYTLQMKAVDRQSTTIEKRLELFNQRKWKYDTIVNIDSNRRIESLTFSEKIKFNLKSTLEEYYEMKFGVKLYQVGKGKPPQKKSHSVNRVFESNNKININYYPLVRAREVHRYNLLKSNTWIHYGIHLAEPRDITLFENQRILIQRIISKKLIDAVLTEDTLICNTDVITLKPKSIDTDNWFFLSIICSKLCAFYIKSNNINLDRVAFPKINTKTLNTFPVPSYNEIEDTIISTLKKYAMEAQKFRSLLNNSKTESEKDYLEKKCNAIDRQIDQLVYELYGLTEEEIKIVEAN